MRRIAILALLLPLFCGPARAADFKVESPHVDKINIIEYGLYDSRSSGKFKDPNAPGGERGSEVNIDLQRATNVIPAQLEMEFGIRFIVSGGPQGALVPVTLIMRFPRPGLKDPTKPKPLLVYQTTEKFPVGSVMFESYVLEHLWEVVPGVWSFELWANGKKMAEQKFNLQ